MDEVEVNPVGGSADRGDDASPFISLTDPEFFATDNMETYRHTLRPTPGYHKSGNGESGKCSNSCPTSSCTSGFSLVAATLSGAAGSMIHAFDSIEGAIIHDLIPPATRPIGRPEDVWHL